MATKSITVEELADCIKADFLYELGKEIVKKTGVEPVELLPDAPDKEHYNYNTILTQYTGAVVLDSLGIPQDSFDHIFKRKAYEILEQMVADDIFMDMTNLRDINKEAAIEAMYSGDIKNMITHLKKAGYLSDILESIPKI